MGLDISLYTKAEREQDERHEQEWSALWERKESGEIAEAQYDELRKEITPWVSNQSPPSERYPDHLFNRRYLRSSYNDSGFNHAVPDSLGEKRDLYWIFEPLGREWDGDEGLLLETDIPALREARKRAEQVADELRSSDRLRTRTVSPSQFGHDWLGVDRGKALDTYREHIASRAQGSGDGWYWTKGGEFFGDGLTILAAFAGTEKQCFRDEPWPAVHLIYRMSDDGFDSYVQSAEITAEFIDEAISLVERDGAAYISWSG